MHTPLLTSLLLALALGPLGCIRNLATGALADALSGGNGAYAKDDDPDLIAQALPFALKTMESLIPEQPDHAGLLAATAGGFTQYAYGFLLDQAEAAEPKDRAQAAHLRQRAKSLLQRGRMYGLRGLSLSQKGFETLLQKDPKAALAKMKKDDVPLLYWTSAAWAAEVTLDKDNLELVADLPKVEAMVRRALELDEGYDRGALHDFMVSYELARPDGGPEALVAAQKHFDRAKELSQGTRLSTLVTWADSFAVKRQDKAQFNALLDQVLAFPLEKAPDFRLSNVLAQRRAKRLKASTEDLFL